MPGNRRCSIAVEAIGPGRGPRQLSPDESRRMNLNDDVVYRCLRLGPLHELHPGRSRSLVRHHYCLHLPSPYVEYSPARQLIMRGRRWPWPRPAMRRTVPCPRCDGEISTAWLAKECGLLGVPLSCPLLYEREVAEIGRLIRGAFRPEDE